MAGEGVGRKRSRKTRGEHAVVARVADEANRSAPCPADAERGEGKKTEEKREMFHVLPIKSVSLFLIP